LNGPGRYSPAFYPDRALNRRNLVLSNMLKHGFISQSQYIDARGKPLDVKIVLNENLVTTDDIAPYYTEYIRQELENMQSQYGFDLYRDGLTVYTSLNTTAQSIADKVVKEQLEVQQRVANSRYRNRSSRIQLLESFRSIPLDTISTLVENEVYMDSLLNKNNTVQTGFVSMDLNNGYVIAYIGGRDFNSYKWNIPIQSARQPGSVFKPFVYTAAIDNGYPVTHQLLNQDVVIRQPDGTRWAPDNYDKSRGGWTTLREGFRRSLNLISVRLVQEIVPPTEVVKIARKMGITTHIDAVDAIALGSSGVKLIEVVSAYSAFPNNGIKVDPVFITRIEDKYGNVIYEHPQSIRHEVLSAETAHIMTTMMQSVVQSGTGQGSHLYYGFKRPAGGKTGTTNEHTDAWFVGYTPQIVTGIWFGMDNPAVPLGPRQSGAVAALPPWSRYMAAVHDSLALPVLEFTRPNGVVELKICNETKMLAGKYCPDVVTELFNDKYKPTKTCDKHKLPSDRYKRKRDR
ncbi:penicillin-binding transpeptidase domain-containing protein, partial [candidate division KSB1 bacterium]